MQAFFAWASAAAGVLVGVPLPTAVPTKEPRRRRRLAAGDTTSEAEETSSARPAPTFSPLSGSSFFTSTFTASSKLNSSSRTEYGVKVGVLRAAMLGGDAAAEQEPDIVATRPGRRQSWNSEGQARAAETKPDQP